MHYHAYVGTMSNPIGFGDTHEGCIDDAIREAHSFGGIGDEPHQWVSEDALVENLQIELVE